MRLISIIVHIGHDVGHVVIHGLVVATGNLLALVVGHLRYCGFFFYLQRGNIFDYIVLLLQCLNFYIVIHLSFLSFHPPQPLFFFQLVLSLLFGTFFPLPPQSPVFLILLFKDPTFFVPGRQN